MHAKKNWSTVLLIKFFTERTFALKVTFLHETARRLNNTNRAIVFAPIANNPYQTNCYARERPHFNIHSCVAICRPSCRTRQKTVHLFFPLFLLTVFFILFFFLPSSEQLRVPPLYQTTMQVYKSVRRLFSDDEKFASQHDDTQRFLAWHNFVSLCVRGT